MNANDGPERIGAYRLVEKLGQGGMAVVYRGERTGEAGFKKKVAIKRMLPAYRRDPSLLERFAAEARTNARLDHPNLVQVLDFGIDPEPYLVLEFIEGVTLGAIMQRLSERHEKLDITAAAYIGAEAASGLDHAHRKKGDDGIPLGIVHRDVSPQNVIISDEGTVKVSDFGLVKAADNVLKTQSGVSIGKMSYMAPEQAAGAEVDARADVFALGVTIWEMLTIRSLIPPDDPANAAHLLRHGGFPKPSTFNREVPARLEEIVMACLAINPNERTPSAQQVAQELREFVHEHAAGYGRQQLARLVQWLFPEKGWNLPEPERLAAQPSPDERASLMPPTPVAVAVARVEAPDSVLPPAPSKSTMPWAALALAAALGAAIVLVLVMVAGLSYYAWQLTRPTAPAPQVSLSEVRFESATPGLRVFLGFRELGPAPVRLTARDLTGEPLVALAPLHQPQMLRAEHLVELTRDGQRVHTIALAPSHRPDIMVYVRYDGHGTARMPNGDSIGQVPGVVRVPTRRGEPNPDSLTVIDEGTGRSVTLPLSECEPDKICVLNASPTR